MKISIKFGALALLVVVAVLGSCATPRASTAADCRVTKRAALPDTVVVVGATAFRRVAPPLRQRVVELTPTGVFRSRLGAFGDIVGRVDGKRFEYGRGPIKTHSSTVESKRVTFGIGLMPEVFEGSPACTDEQLMLGAVAHLLIDDGRRKLRVGQLNSFPPSTPSGN